VMTPNTTVATTAATTAGRSLRLLCIPER
jgi:hypothetical protein